MWNLNLIRHYKVYPAVWYTHYLLNRPVKTMVYKWFPFKSRKAINVFVKIMAMIHDHIICYDRDLGIQYGTIRYYE